MQTEIVEHDGKRIVVSRASVLIGMRRTRLRIEAQQDDQPDIDHQILRQVLYPDLVAAVTSTDNLAWPPSFEDFLKMPEQLVQKWEQAVYRLNPHWMPGASDDDEEQEKKQQTT